MHDWRSYRKPGPLWILGLALAGAIFHRVHGWINPAEWVWFHFLDLIWPFAWLGLGLFLLIWKRQRVQKIVAIVLCSLLFFGLSDDWNWTGRQSSSEADFTVLSLNAGGFANRISGLDSAIAELRKIDPDVLVIQEFGLLDWWQMGDTLTQYMARKLNRQHARPFRHQYNIFGFGVFSRFPLSNARKLYLPVEVGNGAVMYDIQHPKGTITVCNLHLESFNYGLRMDTLNSSLGALGKVPHLSITTFLRQLEQTQMILDQFENHEGPLILAGDFNNVSRSHIYQQFSARYEDAFATAGFGAGYTHWEGPLPLRIDYLFTSPEVEAVACQTRWIPSSDHLAVLGYFRFLTSHEL